MAFIVIPGEGIDQPRANQYFQDALTYLNRSAMAKSIIDGLTALPEHITVKIGAGLVDKYIHNDNGGIIEWDPECTLSVKDKARYRPQVPWVTDATERYGFLWLKKRRIDEIGTISAKVALAHEMGHAYQFFSDKNGYREAMKKSSRPQEDNVIAIENTIVLELRALGHNEGIRWGYMDTM